MNKMILMGNLGGAPEIRYTQSGMAVATLNVAVSERKKEGDGWVKHTEWFRVKTFGKTAENCAQYLDKGRPVLVEGKGRHGKYTDKDGVERYTFDVVADNVHFLNGGGGDGSGRPAQKSGERPAEAGGEGVGDDGFYDDSLPF